jgi:hypothetical protein
LITIDETRKIEHEITSRKRTDVQQISSIGSGVRPLDGDGDATK